MNSINRYAKSLLAKPFVILTGNSGTGKSKIATLFAKWLVPVQNTAFVPVAADWTDNRNVLGYAINLPQTIKLPPNLFVVGTVNVDETTSTRKSSR